MFPGMHKVHNMFIFPILGEVSPFQRFISECLMYRFEQIDR